MKKVMASVPCKTLGVRFAKKIPRGAQANFFFSLILLELRLLPRRKEGLPEV